MKDFVSARWIRAVGLMASLPVVWAIFRINDFPWTGLVWASLVISTSVWVRNTSNGSIRQVLVDVEAEPAQLAVRVPKTLL